MDPSAPGWYPDPYRRHELRYWSGARWSRHVEDGGVRSDDVVDPDAVPRAESRGRRSRSTLLRPPSHAPRRRRPPPTPPSAPAPPLFQDPPPSPPPPGPMSPQGLPASALRDPQAPPSPPPAPDPPLPGVPGPPPRHDAPAPPPPSVAMDSQDEAQALEVELAFGDEPRRRRRGALSLVVGAVAGAAIAAAVVVLLHRSGGADDSDTPDHPDDRLMSVLLDGMHQRFGGTVTDAETRCIADGLVRSVGRDRLVEVGVLDGADPVLSLDLAEKHVAVPRAFDCLDDRKMLDVMVASWPKEGVGQLGPEVAPCIFGGWLKELGRDRLVYVFTTLFDTKPAPLNETLDPDEFDVAIKVLNDCQQSAGTP